MAEILLARLLGPSGFSRPVVVKRILPHFARIGQFRAMFLDEARVAARLRHRNIAQVYELGEDGGELYSVMEYVEGENLKAIVRRLGRYGARLPYSLCAYIVRDACSGLQAAHEMTDERGSPLKLVHRDISPHNLMVSYDGDIKVLDFGIAKALDSSTRTEAGTVKGKFAYMSPEQAQGERLDRRSDIFSLGVVLYELTTARRLFARDNQAMTIEAVIKGEIPRPTQTMADYPVALEAVCLKAMARKPADRYQTAEEMAQALNEIAASGGSTEHPAERLALIMQATFSERAKQKRRMLARVTNGHASSDLTDSYVDAGARLSPDQIITATIDFDEAGSQASELRIHARLRRRTRWWGVLATGIAIAALTLTFALPIESSSRGEPTIQASAADISHIQPAQPLPSPSVADDNGAPSEASDGTEAASQEISLQITSDPPGAMVHIEGVLRGSTPFRGTVDRLSGQRAVVALQKRGFEVERRSVALEANQSLHVVLRQKRAPRVHHRAQAEPDSERPSANRDTSFYRF